MRHVWRKIGAGSYGCLRCGLRSTAPGFVELPFDPRRIGG